MPATPSRRLSRSHSLRRRALRRIALRHHPPPSPIPPALQKKESWDWWTHLASTKAKPAAAAGADAAADPMGGVMDVMRDMYEKGDDATKKMIAEAWTKSRAPDAGGGGGSGGGFGGGFGDGALGNLGGMDDDGLGL